MSGATSFALLAYPTKEKASEALDVIVDLSKTKALTLREARRSRTAPS